jgi:hypothetical protein
MIEALVYLAIAGIIIALIAGLIIVLIRRAPFIDPPLKQWAEYAVYAIAVLIFILRALPLLGVSV